MFRISYWLPLTVLAAVLVTASPALHAAPLEYLEDDATGDFDIIGELRFDNVQAIDVRIVFNYQENGDHYALALTGGVAKFYRVTGGTATYIGTSGQLTAPQDGAETVPFTLQRRDWRMAFVWGTEVITRAYNAEYHDGLAGIIANVGAFEELMVQPVGDIFAEDDFVREENATSVWLPVTGKWEQRSLRDDEQAARQEADKSANAFSYQGIGSAETPAITINGYWFWDVYSMQAAVKPLDDGATGIVLYYQDPANYIVVQMLGRDNPDGGKVEVLIVRNGSAVSIGEAPGGFMPGQWYKLRAAIGSGVLHVWVDDELRIVANTEVFGQGKIGLYTESSKGAFFDDVECGPWEVFVEGFTDGAIGKWESVNGQWLQEDGTLAVATSAPSLAVSGRTAWERYEYSATVRSPRNGSAGLVVAYQGPRDYVLMRWASSGTEYDGKAQIVRVSGETAQVLAEAPLTVPINSQYRAKASMTDGLLRLDIDGHKQVEAFAPDIRRGAIGVFAAEQTTSFDNILVELLPPATPARITKEFSDTSQHPEMAEWASTHAAWVKSGDDENSFWWTKGEYFEDHAVVVTIPDVSADSGTLRMTLNAPEPEMPGYLLSATTTKGQHTLALSIQAKGQEIAAAVVEIDCNTATISYERKGNWLLVFVNDKLTLHTDVTTL